MPLGMNTICGWLAMLCLVWTAISFLPAAVSDDSDGTRVWRWVYALSAVAFGLAAYLLPL
jgi:hypothetical protein